MSKPDFPRKKDSPSAVDPAVAQLRVPPHSVEAEQSLLGGLLLDNQAWDKVGDLINEGDFYRDEHRRIFRQIVRLFTTGKPADVVTVAEALDAAGDGEHSGGLAYLGELAANTPSVNALSTALALSMRSLARSMPPTWSAILPAE